MPRKTATQERPSQQKRNCLRCETEFWIDPNAKDKFCSRPCSAKTNGELQAQRRRQLDRGPRWCYRCQRLLPLSEFPVIGKGYRGFVCKQCSRREPSVVYVWHLKRAFGLSLEDWVALYKRQNGLCAICQSKLPGLDELIRIGVRKVSAKTKSCHTDHCHETGRVRGILCRFCNGGLGAFRDNTESMQRAITYLELHKPRTGADTQPESRSAVSAMAPPSPSVPGSTTAPRRSGLLARRPPSPSVPEPAMAAAPAPRRSGLLARRPAAVVAPAQPQPVSAHA